MPTNLKLLCSLAASLLMAATASATTNVFSIGVNFAPDQLVSEDFGATFTRDTALLPDELAGVPGFQQKNWNNAVDEIGGGTQNGTLSNLAGDDKGTSVPTTTTIMWVSNGTWSNSGSRGAAENLGTNLFPGTANNRLMTGYLDTGNSTTTTVTFSNLPPELLSGGYHVFVYSLGAAVNAARGGSVRVVNAATGVPLSAYKLITCPTTRPTAFVEDAGVNHTDNGTYVRFNNFAASSIRIESTTTVNPNTGTPRAPVNAIQLVAAGLTEPIVGPAVGNAQFFYITISDLGSSQLDTSSVSVQLDGQALANAVTVGPKADGSTTIVYDVFKDSAQFFASGSTHSVALAFKDTTGKSLTATRSFTVGAYTTIPSDIPLPISSLDTTKPGFKGRIEQQPVARGPVAAGFDGNSIAQAERQLAKGYLDPATGQPYANIIDQTTAPDGKFIDENVINLNQDAPAAIGNFSANSTPAMDDELVPGIPGVNPDTGAFTTDNYVVEIQTYLNLKAGFHRLGVNSDDGFRLSVARSPGDVIGLVLGSFNGGRGSADSLCDFAAPVDGAYPIRLLWWEGGSASNLEFFSVDPLTGVKTIINDVSNPVSIRAYREASVTYPAITKVLPTSGALLTLPTADVIAEITDGTVAVDAGSVKLTVNGTVIDTVTKVGAVTTVRRAGSVTNLLVPGANTNELTYTFTTGGQTTTVTSTWVFNVGGTTATTQGPLYTVIPPGNKAPAGAVDTTIPGFKVLKVHQMDRSEDGNQGNGDRFPGDANRLPRPEIQLTGGFINSADNTAFPNLADLSLFNADGTFNVDSVVNFNQVLANTGTFNPNEILPGMPGGGSSPSATPVQIGTDNYAMELVTYLDLKAGAYLMSVNSDDGYILTSAPNPRDTLGTVVAYFNAGGGNANPPNRWFVFVVLEDGLYPFRLVYWEGGGGANIEWMSVEPGSGIRVLVNDLNAAYAVKAYREYTGTPRPWVKFSVSPNPWDLIMMQNGPGPILLKGRTPSSVDATDIYVNQQVINGANTNRPFADVPIGGIIANLGAGTASLLLNNEAVTPEITTAGTDTTVVFKPALLPSGSLNTAGLVYAGVTSSWTFAVQSYVTLPESLSQPSSSADASAQGFRARVKKIRNGTTGIAGNIQRAEDHLRGVLTNPDTAAPGPEADGTYLVPGIINWNQEMRGGNSTQIGNFRADSGNLPDVPIPGIGLATTGEAANANDLISAEVLTYLDLPAGYIKMGVNSDDGFRVTAATGYEADPLILGQFDGGKGASDVPFSFLVTKAGLYPIRVVWFEGSGGANLEFFSYGPNNEKIPVNDANNAAAIKAYYKLQPTTPPQFTKIARENGNLVIEWTGGGTLETTDAIVGGTWTDTSLTSPAVIPESQLGNIRFARVRR